MIEFTADSLLLQPSSTLAVNDLIRKFEAEGIEIINASIGQSPFPVHPSIQQAVATHADKNAYYPTQGIFPLRQQVATFYQTQFRLSYDPDLILIGPGSKIIFYAILFALKGSLFLPVPHWVSYQPQAQLLKKNVIKIIPENRGSYKLIPEDVRQAVLQEIDRGNLTLQDQKILLLTYPNNPTGTSYSPEELHALAKIAKTMNMIVIADEIYALTTFQGQNMASIAKYTYDSTIIVSGLAKDRSLGGYRIGVALLPDSMKTLMPILLRFGAQMWACVAGPMQYAALEAYRMAPALNTYVTQCTAIHAQMVKFVNEQFQHSNIHCPKPEGGFYLFPNWNHFRIPLNQMGIKTGQDLATYFIRELKIGTVPSSAFGLPPEDLGVRIAVVAYEGAKAWEFWNKHSQSINHVPPQFIEIVAPQILLMCQRLGQFTDQLNV